MNPLRQDNQNPAAGLGFTAGHFGLIAGCITLILIFSFVKGDLTLAKLKNLPVLQARSESQPLTYEQARAQAEAAYSSNFTADDLTEQQLAEIDPTLDAGQVLGASTEPIPSIEELFDQQTMDRIPVRVSTDNSSVALQRYAEKLRFLETYYGTPVLLEAVSTQDAELLKKAAPAYLSLVTELKAVDVPSVFVEFHKTKIIYYASLVELTQSMSSANGEDVGLSGALFFGLTDKLNSMQSELSNRYGVSL
jgi:hypothetical protein